VPGRISTTGYQLEVLSHFMSVHAPQLTVIEITA
jgi:hypothetical protein